MLKFALEMPPAVFGSVERLRAQIAIRLRMSGRPQADLARHVGKSQTWISQILNGIRGIPLEDLDRIASFFSVPPGTLLDEQPIDLSHLAIYSPQERKEAGPNAAPSRTHLQTELLEQLLALEFTIGNLKDARRILDFLEANLAVILERAKEIRALTPVESSDLSDRPRSKRDRKPRLKPDPKRRAIR